MDKQTKEQYNKFMEMPSEKNKEICDNFHDWKQGKINSETHDKNSTTLFEEKRKIIADIGSLFQDDRYERFKP